MVVYSFFIFDRHAECIYQRQWYPRSGAVGGAAGKDSHSSDGTGALSNGLPKDSHKSGSTDTRLVFGAVFSLRNMVRKLGGEDDNFVCYRTGQYKLHYYETPTNLKFVMMTDTKANNMRLALHQIYVNLYVEYGRSPILVRGLGRISDWTKSVVKNPLSPIEHPGGVGVYNELFEESLEQFVVLYLLRPPRWR
ncbi:Trafficking protein particle complex subunit BET5 [Microsporum canis]